MTNPLNAVGVIVETTGQGDIVAGSVISDAYFTPAESGAVDGQTYCWKLTEGNDVEFFFASWTAGTSTINRATGHTIQSKIGGTAGTNKIDLAGNARLYVVEIAEAMRQLNNQRTVTGTSDALDDLDGGGVVTYNSSSAVAVSLAQADTAGFYADWFAFVRNINSGAVTITPTTSTINGASTLVLQNGDSALIWSDGTNYQAIVWQSRPTLRKQLFTSSGTFTVPAGATAATVFKFTVIGGGAGGKNGAAGNVTQSGGGGGGGAIKWLTGLSPGQTITVTVGAGGTANGGAGGNTSISSGTATISTVTGGGAPIPYDVGGGDGGVGSGGDVNVAGDAGGAGTAASNAWRPGGKGGSSAFGFGGGGKPGNSFDGTGSIANGSAGSNYGGGGGGGGAGAANAGTGAAGAPGCVLVEWVL